MLGRVVTPSWLVYQLSDGVLGHEIPMKIKWNPQNPEVHDHHFLIKDPFVGGKFTHLSDTLWSWRCLIFRTAMWGLDMCSCSPNSTRPSSVTRSSSSATRRGFCSNLYGKWMPTGLTSLIPFKTKHILVESCASLWTDPNFRTVINNIWNILEYTMYGFVMVCLKMDPKIHWLIMIIPIQIVIGVSPLGRCSFRDLRSWLVRERLEEEAKVEATRGWSWLLVWGRRGKEPGTIPGTIGRKERTRFIGCLFGAEHANFFGRVKVRFFVMVSEK